MNSIQYSFNTKQEVLNFLQHFEGKNHQLNILFSDLVFLEDVEVTSAIQKAFDGAILMSCSTAGEISNEKMSETTLVLTCVDFDHVRLKKCTYKLLSIQDSHNAGVSLGQDLLAADLKHVFILSNGISVNGTRFIEGINSVIGSEINVSGGLAGDNGNFSKTYVADNDNEFTSDCISALGFYGERLITSSGSYGGWDSFGIDRVVTKSNENIVYEIDGQPALELYKSYLGDKSSELPGSALFFPLEMRVSEDAELLVRTILGVNESDNSLTFAGNIPEGSFVRLMKTNVNRVIDGAEKAADIIKESMQEVPNLVIMISCVGRKLVLKQLTQDEIEAVNQSWPKGTTYTGFYSNGELSKTKGQLGCNLHNQTMTLTAIAEI